MLYDQKAIFHIPNFELNMKRRYFTKEESEYICKVYADTYNSEIGKVLGRNVASIKNFAVRNNLKKSADFIKRCLNDCVKNIAGWNKGVPMGENAKGKIQRTWFKKGQKPKSTRPISSERFHERDGWMIKVAEPKVWMPKARYLWQQAHGEIPKGFKAVYKDGNLNNCTLENIQIVEAGNLMLKNSGMDMQPVEVLKTNRLIKQLEKLIKQNE
jgi:HNH endonuclease